MKRETPIIIPVWKEKISHLEEISFQQCCKIFQKKIYFLTFKGIDLSCFLKYLNLENSCYDILTFNRKYFLSPSSYSNLLLSLFFYLRLIKYQYILIYQLDCFIFRDELNKWISSNYSYVGAPWIDGYDTAVHGNKIIGVGNGGFSLRYVKDHLRVLLSFKTIKNNEIYSGNTFFLFNKFQNNEDIFWSEIAGKNFSWFKIPDWKTAAKFSVEVQPRYFFEINNGVLPFGCHAWWRYDLSFWKPHIEKFGYKITE